MSESDAQFRPGTHEEFETLLAAHLCGELDEPGFDRLIELTEHSIEWRTMAQRYMAMERLVAGLPETDKARALGARGAARSSRSAPPARRRFLYAAAASAVLTIGGLSYVWLDDRTSRTLAFPHGRCTSDGQSMRAGGQVGSSVESGSDSFCDVKIKDGGQVAARVFPNSRVRFDSYGEALHVSVERGRVLLDAQKRSGRGLHIHTPGHTVRIIGTRLLVENHGHQRTQVELVNGRAEVISARYLDIKGLPRGLPPEALQKAAAELPELFGTEKTLLEPGSRLRLRRPELTPKLRRLYAELGQAYTRLDVDAAARPKPELLAQELVARGRKILEQENSRELLAASKLSIERGPIPARRAWLLERYGQGLVQGSPVVPGGTIADGELQVNPDKVLEAMRQQEPSKLLYRIHLKDGRVLTGIVEQEGNRYRLTTDKGDIMIARDQVKNLELFVER